MYDENYHQENVNCMLCTRRKYKHHGRCTPCPWLAERIEAGVVGYEEAICETFQIDKSLKKSLRIAIREFHGSMFADEGHRCRMEDMRIRMGRDHKRDTPVYFASMYLLTSNPEIYRRAAHCFHFNGIDLSDFELRGITAHDYTLFSAARDIDTDASHVTLGDLVNRDIVDNRAFCLILNALLIARYGPAVLDIRERSCAV